MAFNIRAFSGKEASIISRASGGIDFRVWGAISTYAERTRVNYLSEYVSLARKHIIVDKLVPFLPAPLRRIPSMFEETLIFRKTIFTFEESSLFSTTLYFEEPPSSKKIGFE